MVMINEKKLYYLLLALLFTPWIQGSFQLIHEKPIYSDLATLAVPTLNENNWLSGRYQYHRERSLHREFGFRPSFVRFHNQLDYWIFNRFNAPSVVRGRQGYLFATEDVEAYQGKNPIESDSIANRMQRAAEIRDLLRDRGKDLLIVFAGSKARYSPEHLPEGTGQINSPGNYAHTLKIAQDLGLECIDFNTFFHLIKDSTRCVPVSKQGHLWTPCGAGLAADSLLRCIQRMLGREVPHLRTKRSEIARTLFEDNDLEKQLNLIFPFGDDQSVCPPYECGSEKIIQPPNVFVLSDASYLTLVRIGIGQCFGRHSHWCYAVPECSKYPAGLGRMNNEKLVRELESCELVMVMATDAGLAELGWGFFESAGALLRSGKVRPAEFWNNVQALVEYIPSDSTWMKHIREKALQKGISTDSAIIEDAIWISEQELK
jgi:hypothetical protein